MRRALGHSLEEDIKTLVAKERAKRRIKIKAQDLKELWGVAYDWRTSKFLHESWFIDKEKALAFFETKLRHWFSNFDRGRAMPQFRHTSAVLADGKYYPTRVIPVSVNIEKHTVSDLESESTVSSPETTSTTPIQV